MSQPKFKDLQLHCLDSFLGDFNKTMASVLSILNVSCHTMSHSWQMLDDFVKSIDQVPEPVSQVLASVQVACTLSLDMARFLIRLKNYSIHTRKHLWMAASSLPKTMVQQACDLPT